MTMAGLTVALTALNAALPTASQAQTQKSETSKSAAKLTPQEAEWERLVATGRASVKRGKLEEATKQFKAAEALARKMPHNNERLSTSLRILSRLDKETCQYEEAEKYARELVDVTRKSGSDPDKVSFEINALATILKKEGKYDQAEKTYLEALDTLGTKNAETIAAATVHDNLGIVYQHQHQFQQALDHHEIAYKIYAKQLGDDKTDTALCQGNMGQALFSMGKYEKAEELMQHSLTTLEKTEGVNSEYAATFRDNLAAVYCKKGEFPKAETMQRQSLTSYEKLNGKDNPDYSICLDNLAMTLAAQGKFEEAKEAAGEASAIAIKVLGAGHPFTKHSLSVLEQVNAVAKAQKKP